MEDNSVEISSPHILDVSVGDKSIDLNNGNLIVFDKCGSGTDFVLHLVKQLGDRGNVEIAYLNLRNREKYFPDGKVNYISSKESAERFIERASMDRNWFNSNPDADRFNPDSDAFKVVIVDRIDDLFKGSSSGRFKMKNLELSQLQEDYLYAFPKDCHKKGYIVIGIVEDEDRNLHDEIEWSFPQSVYLRPSDKLSRYGSFSETKYLQFSFSAFEEYTDGEREAMVNSLPEMKLEL